MRQNTLQGVSKNAPRSIDPCEIPNMYNYEKTNNVHESQSYWACVSEISKNLCLSPSCNVTLITLTSKVLQPRDGLSRMVYT